MAGIGVPELLLVGGTVVLLFRTRRLPKLARSLGRAKHEFRRGLDEPGRGEAKPSDGKGA